ncbi:MAG TPA: hypothetical protein VFX38_04815, partial [Gammaproteobacteria bacterium]|nr:hypothetical protein [Gammaproteobacteria bacterium]
MGPPEALAGALGYSEFLQRVFSGLDRGAGVDLLRAARAPLCRANAAAVLDRAPSLVQGIEQTLAWIALRELTGLACVRESLLAASLLATLTLRRAFAPEPRDGVPDLVVFALGKLGGRELNFYSDLDLV